MRPRLLYGLAAGIAAVALSVPSLGIAAKGGVPHTTKTCPAHHHTGKHKGTRGKRNGATRGRKCGR